MGTYLRAVAWHTVAAKNRRCDLVVMANDEDADEGDEEKR